MTGRCCYCQEHDKTLNKQLSSPVKACVIFSGSMKQDIADMSEEPL